MLVGEMVVRVGNGGRKDQTVVLHPPFLAKLPERVRAEHLAQGVGRIHHAVDDDVDDVNALGAELGVEGLAEHAPARHGRRVRVLPRVAPHRGGGRGHQDRSLAALLHVRADARGGPEQGEGRHAPPPLEHLVARIAKRPVAYLGPEVEDHDLDGTDVRLDFGHPLLDAVGFDRIQQEARRVAPLALDVRDEAVEPFLVGSPAEDCVVALAGEAFGDRAADSGAGADDETHWLHGTRAPSGFKDGRTAGSAWCSPRLRIRPDRRKEGERGVTPPDHNRSGGARLPGREPDGACPGPSPGRKPPRQVDFTWSFARRRCTWNRAAGARGCTSSVASKARSAPSSSPLARWRSPRPDRAPK